MNTSFATYEQVEAPIFKLSSKKQEFNNKFTNLMWESEESPEEVVSMEVTKGVEEPKYTKGADKDISRNVSVERAKKVVGTKAFDKAFEEACKIDPTIRTRKDFFYRTAQRESNFNSTVKNPYEPCYGYFQMHANNIRNIAKTDLQSYLNDPVKQILTANKLYDQNLKWLKDNNLYELGKQKGYNEGAMISGCWLGNGVTERFLRKGVNGGDVQGTTVKQIMDGWMSGRY